MGWQGFLDAIDEAESWLVGQSFWVQVLILLAILGPASWLVAGLIDALVDAVLQRLRIRRSGRATSPVAVSAVDHASGVPERTGRDGGHDAPSGRR